MIILVLLVSFTFQISGPKNFYIKTEKGEQKILVPGYDLPARGGVPALPMKSILVSVPGNHDVENVQIKSVRYEAVDGKFNIAPMPEPAILSFPLKDKQVLKDSTIYGKNTFYPSLPIEFKGVHDFSGQRVASFIFYPFRYNPVTGVLEKVKELNIEFQTVPSKKEMIKKTPLGRKFVRNLLQEVVTNPQDVGDNFILTTHGFDYLVVTTSAMISAFDSLIRWYRKFGIRGVVRTTTWINENYTGRDLAEKIRNYLRVCYQDSGLTFVLLGGDVDQVPARVAYAMTCGAGYVADEDSIRADLYYSDLDGTWDANNNGIFGEVGDSVDLYPDVFVGRAPVGSYTEAMDFVNKVITYESPRLRNYQNRALFFAEVLWSDPFTDESKAKDQIDSLYIPTSIWIDKLYETRGNESSSSVINAINSGVNFMNHDGHGWYTVMGTGQDYLTIEDVDALTNGNRLGILYSIGCWVGAFDRDAISEHFIRNADGGGVAFIGNSRYGWGSPGNPGYGYSDRFDAEFYNMIFEKNLVNIGIALAADKVIFIPYSFDENVYRWHQYQLNLLGDPLMPVWRDLPAEIEASIPSQIIPGTAIRINFTNVDSGQVCLSEGDSILEVSWFYNGLAYLEIPRSASGNLTFGIYSPDHLPIVSEVPVINAGGFVSIDTVLVRDTGAAYPDSVLSPDENGILYIILSNTGNDTVGMFELRVFTTDTIVELSTDSFQIRTLAPGETDTLTLSYRTGDGSPHLVPLYFVVDSDTSIVKLLFTRPILSALSGNIREEVTPGDTTELVVGILNTQPVQARDVRINISSGTPSVHVLDSQLIIPVIPVTGIVRCTLSVYVEPGVAIGTRFRVDFNYRASGYSGNFLTEGIVGVDDYSMDFENGTGGWELGQNWGVVSRRSHSGQNSLYCGLQNNWSYGNSWRTSASTPYIVTSFNPELRFWMWYQVATYGSDGIYVEVAHASRIDTLDFIGSGGALDSLTRFTNSWAEYSYPLNFLSAGDTIRVIFEFVSDNNDSVAEGFYIDDVEVSGNVISPVSIAEREVKNEFFSIYSIRSGLKVVLKRPYSGELHVYNGAGRLIFRKDINPRSESVVIKNLRAGVYFVKVGREVGKAVIVK